MLAGGGICLGVLLSIAVVAGAVVAGCRNWRRRRARNGRDGRRGRGNFGFRDVSDDFAFYPIDKAEDAYEMGKRTSTVGSLQRRQGADAARVHRPAPPRRGGSERVSYHRDRKSVIPLEVVVEVRPPGASWDGGVDPEDFRAESLFPPPPSLLLPPAMSTFGRGGDLM